MELPEFLTPENQLAFGYKDCTLCDVERKGEEKKCRKCSGRFSFKDKILWEINRERIRRKARILSFLFPGIGHIYSGRFIAGVFWMILIPLTLGLVINTWQKITAGHVVLAIMFIAIWFLSIFDAGRGFSDNYAPCENACPSHLHVPDYIALVREGYPLISLALIHENLPFASVCGRICPHPCEQVCVRNEVGDPIAIAAIKRFAADAGYEYDAITPGKEERAGRPKIAIIGAGPAGLSAANTLAVLGAQVVLFDSREEAGGLMYSCIPSFRLPLEELKKDVDFILNRGVDFRGGVTVGKDIEFENLAMNGDYDGLLITVGTSKGLVLPTAGTELQGFFDALTFLERVKFGQKVDLGQKVVIIGGGNVAVDVARNVLRLGARDVTITCLESKGEMPAFPWEVAETLQEGAKLMDATAVKKFFVVRKRVAGFEALKVERLEFDEKGRINPVTAPESEFEVRCDTVVVAIGSSPDLSFIPGEYSLKMRDKKHNTARLIFRDKRYKIPIYMCGDCLTGSSSIVEASASGRYMALNIFEDLFVKEVKKVRLRDNYRRKNEQPVEDSPSLRKRVTMRKLAHRDAISGFEETEKGYSDDEVHRECERCARCNLSL